MSEPSSPSASPKWRRRADARPAEIVQAAYEVFAEKGFAAARLDEVAKRAGVSKGALYLYFETKQDIFEAVVKDAVAPFSADAVLDHEPLVRRLVCGCIDRFIEDGKADLVDQICEVGQ